MTGEAVQVWRGRRCRCDGGGGGGGGDGGGGGGGGVAGEVVEVVGGGVGVGGAAGGEVVVVGAEVTEVLYFVSEIKLIRTDTTLDLRRLS